MVVEQEVDREIPNVGWEVNKLATELAKWCRSCMEYWSSYL